ncbi:hypothetical protein B9Z19DRAFT_1127516 [Tuber borchii]|uniref:Uncharacterized protein n=1 Tax=Tuber borchii TaxID=42251 RepID=A0A2T6ZR43_TUBBO|nr:hypothetical protein B9Z19DRAFT_1127516 [Tuber borchii]
MRLPIAGPSAGLHCYFPHEFRRGLNTVPRRCFTARQHRSDIESGVSSPDEIFHTLDKDVAVLKTQMEDTKEAFKALGDTVEKKLDDVGKKIDSKFNRLMFIALGAVVLGGGFDVWRDGRKGSRS